MKISFLFLFINSFLFCFSQNVKGKIVSDSLPVADVEVINTKNKEVVKSTNNGNFEINASVGNWIVFYHKNYEIKKVFIDADFNYNKNVEINLIRKSEKIEEVLVTQKQPFLKGLKTGMPVLLYNKPSVSFSDGTVYTPFDFMAIGKLIGGLFKNKDKIEFKAKEPVQFRTFTVQSFSNELLISSLKLKSDEIEEFLNYCSFDSKSKEAVANLDKMTLLQFLISKSAEYKRVYQKE